MMKQHALVLGGTGLVGQYLVPRLISQGFDVDVVSRGNPSAKGAIQSNVRMVKADLSDPKWTELAGLELETYDVIYHLAYAASSDDFSDYAVTVESVRVLLEGLSKIGDGNRRHFIYVGSMTVFGTSPTDKIVTEASQKSANSKYAKNKLEATNLVLMPVSGVVSTVLHPTGVYDKKSSRINKYKMLLSSNYVPLTPNLGMNNIVHADDVARALVLCLGRKLEGNVEYIINGQTISYHDWFAGIEKMVEKRCSLKLPDQFRYICRGGIRNILNRFRICCPIYFSSTKGNPFFMKNIYSSDKAAKDFGFKGQHLFQEITDRRDVERVL